MPNISLARSKSASDLRHFHNLMDVVRRRGRANALSYLQSAEAMIRDRRIYFVGA